MNYQDEYQFATTETEVAESRSEDLLTTYLREIGKISRITPEEEIQLARRIQEGDDDALRILVEANLRFVITIAKKFQGCGMALPDLINEGNLGIIEAAKRFDPNRGVKFISYAIWWIRQSIMQALAIQGGVTRLPLKQAGMLHRLSKRTKLLHQELGRDPSNAEIADNMGIDEKNVESLQRINRQAMSLDTLIFDTDGGGFYPMLEDTTSSTADEELAVESFHREMEGLLDRLTEREADIIVRHFGLHNLEPETLDEIGDRYGLTRERIRQIEVKAKEKLRVAALERHLEDFLD